MLRARAQALIKVDAELSLLTKRTRKLLCKHKKQCEEVQVEEAKGKEKCDDWLNTDGFRLVTTKHTEFECGCWNRDCNNYQYTPDKHEQPDQFHRLIDKRLTYFGNECCVSEDVNLRGDGLTESEQQTSNDGLHSNCCKGESCGPFDSCNSENPRIVKNFQNSVEIHNGRCLFQYDTFEFTTFEEGKYFCM